MRQTSLYTASISWRKCINTRLTLIEGGWQSEPRRCHLVYSSHIRASKLLLRSIDPLQLYLPLLIVQVVCERTERTITKQQIDLLKCKLLGFLKYMSTIISSVSFSDFARTLNTNQMVGNVTQTLKATKMK